MDEIVNHNPADYSVAHHCDQTDDAYHFFKAILGLITPQC